MVLGFPKNGRTTVNSVHYVHGLPLAESEFKHDPIHPMNHSNLVDILQRQTERKVTALHHDVIGQGPDVLRQSLQAMRDSCNYLILDVVDQAALGTIAAAVHDFPVLCGSSALAEELPAVWGAPTAGDYSMPTPPRNELGILCAAGSLMPQTRAQVEYLRNKGTAVFSLAPEAFVNEAARRAEIERQVAAITHQLQTGADVVFHSPHEPNLVTRTQALGAVRGLDKTAVARLVSDTIAEVVGQTVDHVGLNRAGHCRGRDVGGRVQSAGRDRNANLARNTAWPTVVFDLDNVTIVPSIKVRKLRLRYFLRGSHCSLKEVIMRFVMIHHKGTKFLCRAIFAPVSSW